MHFVTKSESLESPRRVLLILSNQMKTESDLPDALCTSEQDPLTPWLVFLMNERLRSKRRFCWTSTLPSAAGLSSFFLPPFASNMKVCNLRTRSRKQLCPKKLLCRFMAS